MWLIKSTDYPPFTVSWESAVVLGLWSHWINRPLNRTCFDLFQPSNNITSQRPFFFFFLLQLWKIESQIFNSHGNLKQIRNVHKQINYRTTVKSSDCQSHPLWLHVLGEELLFWDPAASCTQRSLIIRYPCSVTPSISEAHINRNHSAVLTLEEGLCKHLSGRTAPLLPPVFGSLQKRTDEPRNTTQITPVVC